MALFYGIPICKELILFVGDILTPHEYELRAEQPHSIGTKCTGIVDIHMVADICGKLYADAISRSSGQLCKLGVILLKSPLLA